MCSGQPSSSASQIQARKAEPYTLGVGGPIIQEVDQDTDLGAWSLNVSSGPLGIFSMVYKSLIWAHFVGQG